MNSRSLPLRALLAVSAFALSLPAFAAFPGNWSHYEEVTIEFGQPVPQRHSVGVLVDTAGLFSSGLMLANGGDLIIAWDSTGTGNWVEIDGHVRPKTNTTVSTSNATEIWFAVQEPAGISSYPYVGRYRVYSGFSGAVLANRLRNGKNIYRFFDDFVGSGVNTNTWYYNPNYTNAVSVVSGSLHVNGNAYPPNPANQWYGKPTRLVTMNGSSQPTFSNSYTSPFVIESRFRSSNLANDVRPLSFLMNTPVGQTDLDEYPLFVSESVAKGGGALSSDNLRLGKVLNTIGDPVANSGFIPSAATWYDAKVTADVISLVPGSENVLMSLYMDGVKLDDSTDAPTNPFNSTRTSGTLGVTCDPGTMLDVDWILSRDFVPNQPVAQLDPKILLKARQLPGGTEVYWTHTASPGVSFDVLRGLVTNLSEAGGTVSLGGTSCLENDSPDTTTNPSNLDTTLPPAGNSWFYLIRAKTAAAGAGVYGFSTLGSLRSDPGPGCAP